jgi:hypothetical protein
MATISLRKAKKMPKAKKLRKKDIGKSTVFTR